MIDIHYGNWATRRENFRMEQTSRLRKEYSNKSREDLQEIVSKYEGANFLLKILRFMDPQDPAKLEYLVAKEILTN